LSLSRRAVPLVSQGLQLQSFFPVDFSRRSPRGPRAPANYGTAKGLQRLSGPAGGGARQAWRHGRAATCAKWHSKRVCQQPRPTTACTRSGWAPRSGAGARKARERTSCARATRRSNVRRSRTRTRTAFAEGARGRQRLRCSAMARAAPSRVVEEGCGRPARASGETSRSTALRRAVWIPTLVTRSAGSCRDAWHANMPTRVTRPPPLYQFPFQTRAGTDALSGMLCADLDADATIVPLHGRISRAAFLRKLREVAPALVPFVRLWYGQESTYYWWDASGAGKASVKARCPHCCPRASATG